MRTQFWRPAAAAFILAALAIASSPMVAKGVPVGGTVLPQEFEAGGHGLFGVESVETAVKAAVGVLFEQDNICNYVNLTMTNLVSEGKLRVPGIELAQPTEGLGIRRQELIFMSVDNLPVSISDLLPRSDRDLNDELLEYLKLDVITYNCESNTLSIQSQPYGTQTIVPGLMELQNMTFLLTTAPEQETILTFSGDWNVGSFSLSFELSFNFETGNVVVSGDLDGEENLDFRRFVQELTNTELPPIVSGTFQNAAVEADSETGVVIISAWFGENKVYLITQSSNDEGSQFHVAVAVEFSSIQLSNVFEQVLGHELLSIPSFSTITLPGAALIFASDMIESDTISRAFRDCPLLSDIGDVIQEGVTAYLQTGISSSILQMTYVNGNTLMFNVTGDTLDVESLFSLFPAVDLHALDLPDGVSDIFGLTITKILIDVEAQVLSLEVTLPMMLTYFDDILTVTDTAAVISIDLAENTVAITVNGQLIIAGTTVNIAISRDDMEQYVLQASSDRLPASRIFQQFGADVLPTELEAIAANIPFLNFVIEMPQVIFPLSSDPLQVHLSGHPVINGLNVGPTSITIIKHRNGIDVVQGFSLPSVNLAELFGRITPAFSTLLRGISFLNQDIDACILISPENLPTLVLTDEQFQDFDVNKGLSIKATIPIPDSCSFDPFCAVVKFLLGEDFSMTIHGTIVNPSLYSLSASLEDIPVGALRITDTRMEVRVGATTDIGIQGAIVFNNPPLTFNTRIAVRVPTTQVVLEMTTSGCWQNPFTLPCVSICNLQSSFALQPGVPLPTGLAVGGEIRIGCESCGRVIAALGYVGLDAASPQENYFYVEVQDEVTFPSLLDTFCITGIPLPGALADTGFPNGFLASFALVEKVLPHIPLTIPQGYRFNGTINILGLSVQADLTVGLPDGLSMNVDLPVINVGNGLLVISASRSAQNEGATLNADITLLPVPSVNIQAQCYLSVLGISLETNMLIVNEAYHFHIEGNLLNLFQAELTISAPYGNIVSAPFRVRGKFKNNLYSAIEDGVSTILDSVAEEANQAIDRVQREVAEKRELFQQADNGLRAAQNEFDRAHGAFDDAVREVDNLRRRVDSVCRIRSCGSVCIGCFRGTRCCGRLFGRCVCVTPRWEGCCSRITDPACEAANIACRALKAPILGLLDAASATVDRSRVVLDVAREALQAARATVRAAQSSVDVAVAALEAAQDTFQVGLQTAELITRYGSAGQIAQIREITFDVQLRVANSGRFSGQLRGSFLGNDVSIGVQVNLHDIAEMARVLADRVLDGISGLF